MTALREELLRREIAYLRQELEVSRATARDSNSSRQRTAHGKTTMLRSLPSTAGGWTRLLRQLRNLLRAAITGVAGVETNTPAPRRKILVVAPHLPLFDQSSGCLRLKTIISMMGADDWSIAFGSMFDLNGQPGVLANAADRGRYEGVLREAGVSSFLYGPDEITNFVEKQGGDLAWAFLSFPHIAAHFMPVIRSHCPTTRIAYDMVDFHSLRMRREAELSSDSELLAAAERQRAVEVACASAADVTFAVSVEEKAVLLDAAPVAVVEVLPNIFEPPFASPPGPEARKDLFFVGGFWHRPNGDAVRWFVERILPLIQREAPNIILRIAGANADDEVLALGRQPGVEVLGFVPDLAPLFDRHRVFVAPLRYGAGMKGKVGQSLAYGLPVVTTPIGAEGMGLRDGTHLLIASEEEAFALQVLRLLSDDALWSRLSIAGRALIERTLSVDVVRGQLKAVLDG